MLLADNFSLRHFLKRVLSGHFLVLGLVNNYTPFLEILSSTFRRRLSGLVGLIRIAVRRTLPLLEKTSIDNF